MAVGLVVILVGCDIFTNSIEWLGKKLDLNEGVLGSIFAAVGTALPETLIPIVAVIFAGSAGSHANDVGLGAIIGAPFMLATVAMFVTGVAVYIFSSRGRRDTALLVNTRVLGRDIRFFLVAFSVALASGFIESRFIKVIIAIALLFFYAFYVYKHATDVEPDAPDATDEDADDLSPLHFSRGKGDPSLRVVIVQIVAGLALIVGAAYLFVQYVSDVANSIGITPLILSLIIVPLATELPEKFNSVLWVRRSKDTLALGNITGAMVFQSTLPVAFGMSFTPWTVTPEYAPAFAQAAIAIIAAALLFISLLQQKRLNALALVFSGLWYVVWIILVFPLDIAKLASDWGWFR